MKQGQISQRKEGKYLVRWRGADNKQISKIINGDYGQALAYLAEQLNPKAPVRPKLPERTFDSFCEKHDGKPHSRKTRRNAHAVLVCMFNLAVDLRLIERSPVPRRSGPKQEKIEKPALSEEQVFDLLRRVPVQYKRVPCGVGTDWNPLW